MSGKEWDVNNELKFKDDFHTLVFSSCCRSCDFEDFDRDYVLQQESSSISSSNNTEHIFQKDSESSPESYTVTEAKTSLKGKRTLSARPTAGETGPVSFNHSIIEAGKRILGDFLVESDPTPSSQSTRLDEPSRTTNSTFGNARTQEYRSGPTARHSKKHDKARSMTQLLESLSISAATHDGIESDMSEIIQTKEFSPSTKENAGKTPKDKDLHIFEEDGDDDSGVSPSPWLIEETEKILGPRSKIADTESLIGKSPHSFQSRTTRGRKNGSETIFDNESRLSAHQISSVMSAVSSSMSTDILEQTGREISFNASKESLRNDKKRLEAQLAQIAALENDLATTTSSITLTTIPGASLSTMSNKGKSNLKRRKKIVVLAPPGKLGVILSNRYDYSCLSYTFYRSRMRLT
jgi:hypothetical protein